MCFDEYHGGGGSSRADSIECDSSSRLVHEAPVWDVKAGAGQWAHTRSADRIMLFIDTSLTHQLPLYSLHYVTDATRAGANHLSPPAVNPHPTHALPVQLFTDLPTHCVHPHFQNR